MKFGLANDKDNLQLKRIFKNNIRLKEMHVDIYIENPLITSTTPFMLMLRTIENRVMVLNDDNRLILKKNIDKFETYFMNILFSEIKECYYKNFDDYSEFILNIQNLYYRITVFN